MIIGFNGFIPTLVVVVLFGIGNTPKYSSLIISQQIIFNWTIIILIMLDVVILITTLFSKPKYVLKSPSEWFEEFNKSQSINPTQFIYGIAQFSKIFELTANSISLRSPFSFGNLERRILYLSFLGGLFGCFPLLQIKNFFTYELLINVFSPMFLFIFTVLFIVFLPQLLNKLESNSSLYWKFEKQLDGIINFTIKNPYEKKIQGSFNKTYFNDIQIHERKLIDLYPNLKNNTYSMEKITFVLNLQIPPLLNADQPINNPYYLFINNKKELVEQIKSVFTIWLKKD